MNGRRRWPAAAFAAAAAIGAALAGCSAPPAKRFSEDEPLRTADIVNAPPYETPTAAAPPAQAPEPMPSAPAPQTGSAAAGGAAVTGPATDAAAPPPDAQRAPAAMAAPIVPPAPAPAPARLPEAPQSAMESATAAVPSPERTALEPGRWAVQVGVFAVPANAQKDRARVESRIGQSDLAPAQRVVRVERIGNRSHVLVGDLPDRAAAEALAVQLRRLLRQDVVILRR